MWKNAGARTVKRVRRFLGLESLLQFKHEQTVASCAINGARASVSRPPCVLEDDKYIIV